MIKRKLELPPVILWKKCNPWKKLQKTNHLRGPNLRRFLDKYKIDLRLTKCHRYMILIQGIHLQELISTALWNNSNLKERRFQTSIAPWGLHRKMLKNFKTVWLLKGGVCWVKSFLSWGLMRLNQIKTMTLSWETCR